MPVLFGELSKKANPHLLLNDPTRGVDLKEEVSRELETPVRPR